MFESTGEPIQNDVVEGADPTSNSSLPEDVPVTEESPQDMDYLNEDITEYEKIKSVGESFVTWSYSYGFTKLVGISDGHSFPEKTKG